MNKFDRKFNKIINQQNLNNYIASEGIKESLSDLWDSITSIGQSISKAISNGTTWSTNKIIFATKKIWNFITPENTQQSFKTIKSLTKIMPSQIAQKVNKIMQLSNSQQYKSYINKKITNKYESIDKFNEISNSEQKKFISEIVQSFLSENKNNNDNKIISQVALSSTAIVMLVTAAIPIIGGLFTLIIEIITGFIIYGEVKKLGKDIGLIPQTPEEKAKHERDAALIKLQQEKDKIEHQKWKDKELRQKLYQQIINVREFQKELF